MNKVSPLLLAILSGLLLFGAWPVSPFTFLIFVSFVPLLWLGQSLRTRTRFFAFAYLSMLIWNTGSTWWMCNASLPGGISAILANSLLMSIPWLGYYNISRRMGERIGLVSLLLFWMSFEYIHLNWELSWPWLTIGNVFALHPNWVQWYEFTGTSGGTLWVLIINILVYKWVRSSARMAREPVLRRREHTLALFLIVSVPMLLSYRLLQKQSQGLIGVAVDGAANVVVVQPNVDPWDDKFAAGREEAQIGRLISLSEAVMDVKTALVVWPETAIPVSINEDSMSSNYFLQPVWQFLQKHPSANLVTGIEGFRIYPAGHKSNYSRKLPDTNLYFDSYNSAALLDSHQASIYHKSRLVPGAEVLPSFLHFMEAWFEKFGGTTGSYARQNERTVLHTFNHSYAIAPAVCYESIYGEFMAEYVRGGANLIAIITNDGWWGNTAGYLQHESYARLRCLETRRWVCRSANTGISCFIDPTGREIDPQPWNKATAIKLSISPTGGLTFFVRHGDLLSKVALGATLLLLVWNFSVILKNKIKGG